MLLSTEKGTDIRFIPAAAWVSIAWSDDDTVDVGSIVDEFYGHRGRVDTNLESLSLQVSRALDQVDFNEVRRIGHRLHTLRSRFHGDYEGLKFVAASAKNHRPDAVESVTEIASTYLRLTKELERAGLLSILFQNSAILRERHFPYLDWRLYDTFEDRLLLESMAVKAMHDGRLIQSDGGRGELERIQLDRVASVLREPEAKKPVEESKSRWPKRLRVIAAAGKIVVGGGLSSANVGAGILVGIVTVLPTLGAGAIAGAIAVATSAYTGINAACDGIKDLASAVESK